jgi:alginate O-acetyltransferase complex protein AlgI
MLFYSPEFFPFFAVVFAVYWLLPKQSLRTWVLLAASFYFYATWNQWLALIIGVTSVIDYLVARGLDASTNQRWRRTLLGGSLVMNLGLLAYFKYVNFFLDTLETSMHAAGMTLSMPTLQVILPIGISFYTFEAINYTVDVYRKRVPAERSLPHFLLFITFFPHLVAGPIVRARDFLPQIAQRKRWDWSRMQLGCEFFLLGLFKKLAIADRLAMVVDPVFADTQAYNTSAVWLAVVAYSIQIYCDFSGYTDMAIGLAHTLGFKLAKNFDMPYASVNISEFWRRWHISLSSWLRDYLFIPLGGSRGGTWLTYRNLMLTMTLGGLWHGASWTFVAWGIMHGTFLILHKQLQDLWIVWPTGKRLLQTHLGRAVSIALTFVCVSLAWVCFRAPDFATAAQVYEHLFVPHRGTRLVIPNDGVIMILLAVLAAHLIGHWHAWRRRSLQQLPAPAIGLAYAIALVGIIVLIPEYSKPFIYFQF